VRWRDSFEGIHKRRCELWIFGDLDRVRKPTQAPATIHGGPLVGPMSSTVLVFPYHERLRSGFRASSATDSLTVFPLSCLSPPHQLPSSRVRLRVRESTPLPRKDPKSSSVPPSLFQRKGASWAKSAECISTAAEWCVAHPLVVIDRVGPRVGC